MDPAMASPSPWKLDAQKQEWYISMNGRRIYQSEWQSPADTASTHLSVPGRGEDLSVPRESLAFHVQPQHTRTGSLNSQASANYGFANTLDEAIQSLSLSASHQDHGYHHAPAPSSGSIYTYSPYQPAPGPGGSNYQEGHTHAGAGSECNAYSHNPYQSSQSSYTTGYSYQHALSNQNQTPNYQLSRTSSAPHDPYTQSGLSYPTQYPSAQAQTPHDPQYSAYSAPQATAQYTLAMPLISNRETVAVELEAGHPRIVKDSRGSIGNKDRRIASQFKRRKPEYFIVGRVFKVLWPELQGNSSKGGVSLVSQKVYGQKVYAKIRYFVVVNVNEGSCWCLPISTYSGQGVGKLGEVKKYHAIIYTGDDCPAPTPLEIPVHGSGEEPMGHPIAVQVKDADNKLDPMSRINFQKIYTVETNVKVYDFGRVVDDNGSLSSLRWQFNHALLNVSNDQLPSERIIAGGTAGRREKEKIKEEEEEQEEEEGYAQYGDEAR